MRELQTEVGNADGGHDRDVGVGADFEGSETTGDDSGADDESSKDGLLVGVFLFRHRGDGPEQDGSQTVQGQSHDEGRLVTEPFHDDGLRSRQEREQPCMVVVSSTSKHLQQRESRQSNRHQSRRPEDRWTGAW